MSYDEFDKFVRGLLSVVLDAERCYSDRCGFMHFGRSNSDSTEGCREAFALPVQIYAYKKMAQAVERMRQLKKEGKMSGLDDRQQKINDLMAELKQYGG